MRKMLLSFKPEAYEKIKSGEKIFEHRRNFPDEPIMAYMYVSSPIKAVMAGRMFNAAFVRLPLNSEHLPIDFICKIS